MDKKKITVGILFGGKSAEHEVSLQSAKNVIDSIDTDKYHPVLIGIDKSGNWHMNDRFTFLLNSDDPKLIKLNQSSNQVALIPQKDGKIYSLTKTEFNEKVDVVFPILHGPLGEDGTIQGLLKLANIPFVGASILGSAVGMDKDIMKRLLRDANLPISQFVTLKANEKIPSYQEMTEKLGSPIFVKPSNMGSSVGVSKVADKQGYEKAIVTAFDYDRKIIIEEFIEGDEVECSVLGNDDPIASVPGRIISTYDFYSYEAKYIDEKGAVLEIPAKISESLTAKIQKLAIATFQTLSCEGLGRVDLFLTKNNEVIINEINTIPGFTSISMYPKLWEASGISYTELIDSLLRLAIERFEQEAQLKTTRN